MDDNSSAEDRVNKAIFALLEPLIPNPIFHEPNDANVNALFGVMAPCVKQDGADWRAIWKARRGENSQLMQALRAETQKGKGQYQHIIQQFESSVPSRDNSYIDQTVADYLREIRPAMLEFVSREDPLCLWKPHPTLPYSEFLANLKIPDNMQKPDMLLHNLGIFSSNSTLQAHVEAIFRIQARAMNTLQSTVLLNTSGSGKTRLVLEGLCQHWGFYFTCLVDSFGHGSKDLERAIHFHILLDPCFHESVTGDNKDEMKKNIRKNSEIAQLRLQEVLLARLYLLSLFLEVIEERHAPQEWTDSHRKLWVLLQVSPSSLGHNLWDIFATLAERIKGISREYMWELMPNLTTALKRKLLINNASGPLYYVVDEAQSAATSVSGAFRSFDRPHIPRPILREIARAMPQRDLSLIIAGTGISKAIVEDTLSSTVLKSENRSLITDIGAFDTLEEHREYMTALMPDDFVKTEEAQALFKRVSIWLRGRYRFTATFMRQLLAAGFQNSHAILDSYISRSTAVPTELHQSVAAANPGFKPTDCQRFRATGPRILFPPKSENYTFKFEKLKSNSVLLDHIREYALRYWMRSNLASIPIIPDEYDFIEAGFARYSKELVDDSKHWHITLDEPLVILALIEWLKRCDVPFSERLRQAAAKAVTEANGANGLEEYLVLYFSAVFDGTTRINEVFDFHGTSPSWVRKTARLVSLYKVPGQSQLEAGTVGESSGPCDTIGMGGSFEETQRWLSHDTRAPFCFPDKMMGPDILFILELSDGSRIWVAVQSKFSSSNCLPKDVLIKAMATVAPEEYYGSRKVNWPLRNPTCRNSSSFRNPIPTSIQTARSTTRSRSPKLIEWMRRGKKHRKRRVDKAPKKRRKRRCNCLTCFRIDSTKRGAREQDCIVCCVLLSGGLRRLRCTTDGKSSSFREQNTWIPMGIRSLS
ncbi:hypothetical protein B0H10DRAFT_1279962 [Mycena sp. CBHHK59/15]|nr:hypothetical protein B0H10DRAFT_1279962 [Mycena sp. CBHHK59/15]